MAGSKKNKAKKVVSHFQPPSPVNAVDDNELMDELMAQLDSRDKTVQEESANIINEMQIKKAVDTPEPQTPSIVSTESRQSSKSRHQARQVRYLVTVFNLYLFLRWGCLGDRRGRHS